MSETNPVAMLEQTARRKMHEALDAERNKDYETAIDKYKRAMEALEEIIRNYPEHPMVKIYKKTINELNLRLKYLENKASQPIGETVSDEVRVEIKGDINDSLPDFVLKEKPSITFDDIAGLDEAKRAIKEAIIYPIKRPDLFPLGWPRGILLYGPPGTGKTMLAAAVANEINGEFIYLDAANIMSKWLGEGEKNVKKVFDYARNKSKNGIPVIVFIDELDALLGVHTNEVGGEVRVRNQFLKEMDGLQDKSITLHVYVIGATNKPWALDEPFIRRFQKRIYVPLPNKEARLKLLSMLTSKIKIDEGVNFDQLSEMLEGYSGSDIKDIVQDAYMIAVREYFESDGKSETVRPININDFNEAIKQRRPSVNKEMLKLYESWTERFKAI
ncbi:AAA+ family ATPase [Caldisphaera lagunensis DSM 15908]|uniref:AAA+ family ATPase n=1 Tax=Caldisphaera lagunensis (strain DSM 15908 / JCM 11604 / ANMR 0165 / IC-154) TaxID=1056495 RepID=L0ABB7_CALLD|nr:ATP-binding protein [Caldisphaera lagunensis]AFZ70345.1 AAA+ family ATPase [Caldisphaera lagunensis DSM 15908]